MTTGKSSIKQEVTMKLFKNPSETDPIIEQDMVTLLTISRNEDVTWTLEFQPDFLTEPIWSNMVKENQFEEIQYYVELYYKGHRSRGLVRMKGPSNNPCRLIGIDLLSKWKKVL